VCWRGIIPACAGSTGRASRRLRPRRDHPRVRGEHDTVWYDVPTGQGSSPRARGAHLPGRRCMWGSGIIPACAGSTPGWPPSRGRRGDHPRVRGEHLMYGVLATLAEGSSPRARGALVQGDGGRGHEGIIPACAGSTARCPARVECLEDHPRVRGEHGPGHLHPGFARGSSPRARGARHGLVRRPHRPGIIPACAGSTNARPSPTSARWDHPRVRGEHLAMASRCALAWGSSPRARGALHPP